MLSNLTMSCSNINILFMVALVTGASALMHLLAVLVQLMYRDVYVYVLCFTFVPACCLSTGYAGQHMFEQKP